MIAGWRLEAGDSAGSPEPGREPRRWLRRPDATLVPGPCHSAPPGARASFPKPSASAVPRRIARIQDARRELHACTHESKPRATSGAWCKATRAWHTGAAHGARTGDLPPVPPCVKGKGRAHTSAGRAGLAGRAQACQVSPRPSLNVAGEWPRPAQSWLFAGWAARCLRAACVHSSAAAQPARTQGRWLDRD